jgi:putative membrane protein
MPPDYVWWGPMWVFPMIMPIVMLVALILCLYFMFGRGGGGMPWQHTGTPQGPGREVESPLDILKRRYAKGEISKDEYEQIKRDLQS